MGGGAIKLPKFQALHNVWNSSFKGCIQVKWWIFINFCPEILDRIPGVLACRGLFFAREKLGGHHCTGDKSGSIPGFWHVFLWLADMLQQLTRWCYFKGSVFDPGPGNNWRIILGLLKYSLPLSNLLTKRQFFPLYILQLNKHMNLRIVGSFHINCWWKKSGKNPPGMHFTVFENINLNCRISETSTVCFPSPESTGFFLSGEQCNADDHVNLRCSRRYFTTSRSELFTTNGHRTPLGVCFFWRGR